MLDGKQVKDDSIAAAKVKSDIAGNGLLSAVGVLSLDPAAVVTHTGGVVTHTVDTLQVTGTPDTANDAVNKSYVDAVGTGTKWKGNCDLTSTGNLILSGEQTIDGILTAASRVLVKDQTIAAENGIYLTAAGAWSRTADMDAAGEFDSAGTYVEGGTANSGTTWNQTETVVVLDTDTVTFVQTNGAGSINAGVGLSKVGNTISVNPDATTGATVAPVSAGANGTGVAVDNDTITHTGGTLAVGANSIGVIEIAEGEAFAFTAATGVTDAPATGGTKLSTQAYADAAAAAGGGSITTNDREAAAAVTAADGATTGLAITSTPKGDVHLSVNGVAEIIGDGVKTKAAYFSADGGTTARAISAVVATDTLYWNGTVAGYELAITDTLSLLYEV